jgi:hypothetical protein
MLLALLVPKTMTGIRRHARADCGYRWLAGMPSSSAKNDRICDRTARNSDVYLDISPRLHVKFYN